MNRKINYTLFIFLLFNFFVKFCDCGYYKIDDNGNRVDVEYCPAYMNKVGSDYECIDNLDDCRSKGLMFYNREELMCYSSLPSGYYANEYDITTGFPKEDEGGNTYTKECKSSYFPKLTFSTKRCQRECDSGEYFRPNDPNNCLQKCDDDEYIGSNNECLDECPYFYIEDGKKCVTKCKDYGKFFFKGDKKCYDSCQKGSNSNYYYDSDNNECLDTCIDNDSKKYAYKTDTMPTECITLPSGKNFDEDYFILDKCDEYLSYANNMKCISYCINYNYTDSNKQCTSCQNIKYKFKDEEKAYCIDSCSGNNKYIPVLRSVNKYRDECLESCPQNIIADDSNNCNIIKCPEGEGQSGDSCVECQYYIVNDQEIVICQESCNGDFVKDELDKECVEICPEYNNIIVSSNICGKSCSSGKYIKKADTQPSTGDDYTIYECTGSCDYYVKENDEIKEKCFDKCPPRFQFMYNDNKYCIQKCEDNEFYYINDRGSNSYYTCTNTNKCTNSIYCEGKCTTEANCYNNGIYYISNNICVDSCESKYRKKSSTGGYITECTDSCTSTEYINGLECIQICPEELNYIGKNNICRNGCKSENGDPTYYYISEAASSTHNYPIYLCDSTCPNYSRSHDKLCYDSCPDGTYYSGKICYENCFLSSNKFSLMEDGDQVGQCLSSCRGEYKYYYETEKVCLQKCMNDDYADSVSNKCVRDCSSLGSDYYIYENNDEDGEQKKFCVKSCPDSKPYLYGDTCVESCGFQNSEKRFIIKGSSNKVCLTDCISPKVYYIIKNSGDNEYYECSKSYTEETGYSFYAPNSNPGKVAILSLKTCNYNDPIYKYKIGDACYEECPSEAPFSKKNTVSDNSCYDSCPSDTFHEIDPGLDSFICKDFTECKYDYVDEVEKLCLREDEECPDSRLLSYYSDKYVCLSECKSPYGQYLTEYNTCVNDCTSDNLVSNKNLILDEENCVCEYLYYRSENERTCFADSKNKVCKEMESIYNISVYGQNECITVCDNNRILSLNEEVCYDSSESCTHDENTNLIVRTDGILKCDCKDKFYLNSNNIKTCYDGVCATGYNKKYVPEIMRCLKDGENCPSDFNHLFIDKYCLRECPSGSTETVSGTETICKCEEPKKFWREISENNYECLVRCFDIHPVYVASTYKCEETCPDDYPIFYDYKCFSSCDYDNENNLNIKNGEKVQIENSFAQYTCDCSDGKSWYNDDNTKYCVDTCFDGTPSFKYMVYSTKECVNECPSDYPYYFNEYCYSSCEGEAKEKYGLQVKTNAPYTECQCLYAWYYTNAEKTRKQCLNSDQTCISSNIGKNYLIRTTKECVEKCPTYLFEFNYECYEVCPKKTVDNISEDGNYCSCNLNDGYWYEYKENDFTYKECGLDECPEYEQDDGTMAKTNLIENEKKCVKNCRTDGDEDNKNYYAFKNVCLKDCPILTKTNEENNACFFYDLTDDENIINNKDKFKDAANIQTNELYAKSETSYNKFGFSFEIYPINDLSMKSIALNSNKTYIDFSSCLERIYSDKNVSAPETILIAKYDLLPEANSNINGNNDKYLINPVEYELFSSSDTNEKLDALVCEPYEILVSYPLSLSKFDVKVGDVNQNEFRDKFELGKLLHSQDSSIDTFNFNNSIYKTFCKGLEIDGKDLVFEDRYKYLYPYNKILCESNCTLNNTDFDLERVNCLCIYKGDFDFYRKEYETNDIYNDPDYYIPSQSGANAEVIKCLFNFTFSQATIKNEAFYCCFLITSVEIVLLIINIIYGIKGVSDNIKLALNKLNDMFSKNKNNQNKNGNIVSTSNRPLNNPPRRNNYEEEKDVHNNNDNITSESYDNKSGNSEASEFKSEYIPTEYSPKFFKENDRGVLKKIERSKIPFRVSPDTQYLIDKRNGGENENNYIIITDANTSNNDINKMIAFIKDKKLKKNIVNKNDNKFEPKTKNRINLFENSKNNIGNYKKPNEKNLIKIKAINPVSSSQEYSEDITIDDFEGENEVDEDSGNASCLTLIRREQLLLRTNYEKYISKKHPSNSYIFFAEILDKIYLVKIILFLGKYEIFFIQLSLYIFCYLLLLSLICGFFTIKVIKKIWEKTSYPDLNFYLLYGLISHIILWVIYKIFLYLLDWNDKIKELFLIKKGLKEEDSIDEFNDNSDEKNQNIISKKYKEQTSQMRFRIFVFYLIMFAIIIFCTIYLISFFSIYTGTKKKVFIAFFISLFEIILIKILYGICLAALRLASKINKLKSLYDLVYIFDKFIS